MIKRSFACFAIKFIELYNLNLKYRVRQRGPKEKGREKRDISWYIYDALILTYINGVYIQKYLDENYFSKIYLINFMCLEFIIKIYFILIYNTHIYTAFDSNSVWYCDIYAISICIYLI